MTRGSRTNQRRALEALYPELEVARRERGCDEALRRGAGHELDRRLALVDKATQRLDDHRAAQATEQASA